jgi:isocitrate dehydrogenase
MTKDLALLVGDEQGWLSTEGFLDTVGDRFAEAMKDFV